MGEWTAQYIALRGVADPDAFPAADAGLLRRAASLTGEGDARGRRDGVGEHERVRRPRSGVAGSATSVYSAGAASSSDAT